MDIFNIHIEFNHDKFRKKIEQAIAYKHAGYVCVIDGNVLSQTYFNSSYHNIVCKAFVNTLEEAVVSLWQNTAETNRLGAASLDKLRRRYSSDVISQQWQQLINTLTSAPRS